MLKNFTVITSGGCNAKCSFCTDPMNYKPSDDYLANLVPLLTGATKLPGGFKTLSISGGEPTISSDFYTILSLAKTHGVFNKIVLTTNGTKLLENVVRIGKHVNHVNVSRHAIGYEDNVKIFGNKQIIDDTDLEACCIVLGQLGVDVNLNHVYDDKSRLTKEYVHEFIKYAKSVKATKVTFRYDQNLNTLEETYLEKQFSDYRWVEDGECPVCRSRTILVDGMYVTFKSSFAEPSGGVEGLYELIYHTSGKLTTDWEGKKEYKQPNRISSVPNFVYTPPRSFGSGGCGNGSGGCGSR